MTRPPTDEEFAELVHACWASLYRTAYLMLGDRAEDDDGPDDVAGSQVHDRQVRDSRTPRATAQVTSR
jgi:hypothetical protein